VRIRNPLPCHLKYNPPMDSQTLGILPLLADEIKLQEEVSISDHFLENGIFQIEYELRPFLAFLRDLDSVELVVGGQIFKAIYRKGQAYLLCTELKDLFEQLALEAGERIIFQKGFKEFRRLYLILPVSSERLEKALCEQVRDHDLPKIVAEFPVLDDGGIQAQVRSMFETDQPREIRLSELSDALKEQVLRENLKTEDLLGMQGLDHVERFPHQLHTVRRVLFECQGRALLADEVGLGKTVEAGLIVRELMARGEVRSILVVTPASLTFQWQQELLEKFGLNYPIVDDLENVRCNPSIIMSLDTAKTRKFRSVFAERSFDLMIVDEAHKLKNRKTQNYQFVKGLASRFLLLLTATPIQNDLVELYNLLHLVSPGGLGTLEGFRRKHVSPYNSRLPIRADVLRASIRKHMIRHSRAETNLRLPIRRVLLHGVQAYPDELQIYQTLSSLVRQYYPKLSSSAPGMNRLTLMLLQKLATSSPQALGQSLEGIVSRGGLDSWMEEGFRSLIHDCDSLKKFSKWDALKEVVLARLSTEKILIFTQFRATQKDLVQRLKKLGIEVVTFHGEMTARARNRQVECFKGDARIMVSTDSGAEGWNFQFAHVLVNFDFPWNPMKMEQRIGRVHRLGQQHEVLIVNLFLGGTLDEYIVDLLSQKIRLFERVVGELEMILGAVRSDLSDPESLDQKIMKIVVECEGSKEQKSRMDEIGRVFEEAGKNLDEVTEIQESVLGENA
jgi:SNF2 family DNA or RNA helicase